MKRTILALLCLLGLISVCQAQDTMRIHYKNGGHSDVAIEQVDSITFAKGDNTPVAEVSLIGAWLWGSQEQGYYELLTINNDHTYTGYDNYFLYGFDTITYGWWAQVGAMITLQSNGKLACEDGDSFVFADGVTAAIHDNKLVGLAVGVTYVQKYVAGSDAIFSYKVIVE